MVSSSTSGGVGRIVRGFLVACVMLAMLGAGMVIHIATDRGELIVKTEDPNVRVLVKRGEQSIREWELDHGENRTTIRSGHYEIELLGDSDRLQLSQDKFTLLRGDEVVVTVERRESVAEQPAIDERRQAFMQAMGGFGGRPGGRPVEPKKAEPKYDGKTYSEWLAELETERKVETLIEAVRAFTALENDDLASEGLEAVLGIMRRYGSKVIDDSPRAKLIEESQRALWSMPMDIAAGAIVNEIEHGNLRSREFLTWVFNPSFSSSYDSLDFRRSQRRLYLLLGEAAPRIVPLLLQLSHDEVPETRNWALQFLISYGRACKVKFDGMSDVVARLQESLQEDFDEMTLVAVSAELSRIDPDTDGLALAVAPLLKTYSSNSAVDILTRLGPRAEPAVAVLVETLDTDYRALIGEPAHQYAGMYGGGSFGGYGGMGIVGRPDIRKRKIELLGNIGPAARAALPILKKYAALATADSSSLAKAATQAIEKISGSAPEPDEASDLPSEKNEATRRRR